MSDNSASDSSMDESTRERAIANGFEQTRSILVRAQRNYVEYARLLGSSKGALLDELVGPLAMTLASDEPNAERFPTHALPATLREIVVQGAQALCCDPCMIALPLLSAVAGSVGNTRCVEIKPTWREPCILWTCIVAPSGMKKSPAFDLALHPLRKLEQRALRRHKEAVAQFEQAKLEYENARSRGTADREVALLRPPERPRATRLLVSSPTIESLGPLLRDNPRGLLLQRDELMGLFRALDAYRNGRGGDAQHWLEFHRAGPLLVDRKSDLDPLHVARAAVSVSGTTQPETLRRVFGPEHIENGLAARFLFARPSACPVTWSDAVIDLSLLAELERMFERLLALEFTLDADGTPQPIPVRLSPAALARFKDFQKVHCRTQSALGGALGAAWSKLEGYCPRLALVVHCARCAASKPSVLAADEIDERSMTAAIELVAWFKGEALGLYAMLEGRGSDTVNRAEHIDVIRRMTEDVTVRAFQRATGRRFRTARDAEGYLDALVAVELGRWEHVAPSRRGGHPIKRFVLTVARQDAADAAKTGSEAPADEGSGSVNGVGIGANGFEQSGEATADRRPHTSDARAAADERAAILEYEAELSREEAEIRARAEVFEPRNGYDA